jgi:MFS family permease
MRAPGTLIADAEAGRSVPVRHVVAVVLGNGLEFYDFLCYAIFAVYIGKAFFPSHNASLNLLFSLATFGIGFATRPIGGIVLGGLGDRIGRKPAMLLSFSLMGMGMLGVALTPTYAAIGLAAPALLVFFRLVQGFALGGEVGPTTAYLVEAAPPEQRGFYGSMQFASQDAAILLASLVGVVAAGVMNHHALEVWGWRLAFLLGVAIVPFGLLIRSSLPETLHEADDAAASRRPTLAARVGPHLRVIVSGLLILSSATIAIYTLTYMATYALTTLHMPPGVSFGTTLVLAIIGVIFAPIAGSLSDRVGRKPVTVVSLAFLLVSIIPAFWLVSHFRSTAVLYASIGLLTLIDSLAATPIIIALTEALPAGIRSGGVATVYALAIAVFGGSAQFIIAWLIHVTGDPLAPAYYWTAATVVGLLAALFLPESAPRKVAR